MSLATGENLASSFCSDYVRGTNLQIIMGITKITASNSGCLTFAIVQFRAPVHVTLLNSNHLD